jgi:hypothetical protein
MGGESARDTRVAQHGQGVFLSLYELRPGVGSPAVDLDEGLVRRSSHQRIRHIVCAPLLFHSATPQGLLVGESPHPSDQQL